MITSRWIRPGEDISQVLVLRKTVFQTELGWTQDQDEDALDHYCYHLMLYYNDVPAACGRICYSGPGIAKLSRICVLPKFRRQGIGDGLVKVLDYKASQLGMKLSRVETVPGLEKFYMRIGFVKTGEMINKNGMDLITMQKETNDGTSENCAHQCSCAKG